jgi:GMP synthase-like glutamine amidotransferase
LGVCFGHQILARALGGRTVVAQSSTPEFGWTQIQTIQKNELFQDLPNSFCSFSAHFEEVIHLPEDCISFAKSKDCQIQAFQLKHTSVYGIQFHPEKAFEEAQKILNEMKNNSSFVSGMRHMRPKNIFLQKTGELIFRNFLKMDKKN